MMENLIFGFTPLEAGLMFGFFLLVWSLLARLFKHVRNCWREAYGDYVETMEKAKEDAAELVYDVRKIKDKTDAQTVVGYNRHEIVLTRLGEVQLIVNSQFGIIKDLVKRVESLQQRLSVVESNSSKAVVAMGDFCDIGKDQVARVNDVVTGVNRLNAKLSNMYSILVGTREMVNRVLTGLLETVFKKRKVRKS